MIKIGDKAPNFKGKALVENNEKEISLSDFKGSKVALYFYPKDMTPGCTIQAKNLRDNYKELTSKGIVIIGVSKDDIKSHSKFSEKKELPFILISDEDTKISSDYGVWGMKKFMGKEYMGISRNTFLIDEKGNIVSIIDKPKVAQHAKEIIESFE